MSKGIYNIALVPYDKHCFLSVCVGLSIDEIVESHGIGGNMYSDHPKSLSSIKNRSTHLEVVISELSIWKMHEVISDIENGVSNGCVLISDELYKQKTILMFLPELDYSELTKEQLARLLITISHETIHVCQFFLPKYLKRDDEDGSGQPVILQRGHGFVQDSVHEVSPTITGKSWKDNNHIAIPKNKDYQVPLEGETSDEYWGRMTEYEKEHPIPESEKLCIPVLTPDRVEKRQKGRRFKEDGDPSFTITTQDRHGIYDGYSIRRLTPLECWRLMDFPDQALHSAVDAGMKDSQLYKQAGNSIPVGLLVGITKGLKKLTSKNNPF